MKEKEKNYSGRYGDMDIAHPICQKHVSSNNDTGNIWLCKQTVGALAVQNIPFPWSENNSIQVHIY